MFLLLLYFYFILYLYVTCNMIFKIIMWLYMLFSLHSAKAVPPPFVPSVLRMWKFMERYAWSCTTVISVWLSRNFSLIWLSHLDYKAECVKAGIELSNAYRYKLYTSKETSRKRNKTDLRHVCFKWWYHAHRHPAF